MIDATASASSPPCHSTQPAAKAATSPIARDHDSGATHIASDHGAAVKRAPAIAPGRRPTRPPKPTRTQVIAASASPWLIGVLSVHWSGSVASTLL